jgi:hypothetical protein
MALMCFNDNFSIESEVPGCTLILPNIERCIQNNDMIFEFEVGGLSFFNENNQNSSSITYNITPSCCQISKIILDIGGVNSGPISFQVSLSNGNPYDGLISSTGLIELFPENFNLPSFPSNLSLINVIFSISEGSGLLVSNIQAVCKSSGESNIQVINPYGCNNGRITVKNFNVNENVTLITPSGKSITNSTGIFYVIQPGEYYLIYFNPDEIIEKIIIRRNLMC